MKEGLEGLALVAVGILAWGKVIGAALGLGLIILMCWRLIRRFKSIQQARSCT